MGQLARKELGCCTHADCLPSVTTVLCAHDVVTHFFQNAATSKVCSDFNEQCEALRVVKMNLQLSSGALLLMFVSRIALVGLLHSQSAGPPPPVCPTNQVAGVEC